MASIAGQLAVWLLLCYSYAVACVQSLGSMSSAAAAYGGNGPALCHLRKQQQHEEEEGAVECIGSDAASVYGAPIRLSLLGLTAGDGFVCGLTASSQIPYCWGNNVYVQQGTPASIGGLNLTYQQICAGDNHLCARREAGVDCWGYNMTGSFLEGYPLLSITAGSFFTCGLFAINRTVVCWGDESGSNGVITRAPKRAQFRSISAGGYHVCGILQATGATLCWGRPLTGFPGNVIFNLLVGGKLHVCGLLASSPSVSCWGLINPPNSTPPPSSSQFAVLVAGDYYTCGLLVNSLEPVCWGSQFPSSLRPASAVSPNCSFCTTNCPSSCVIRYHHSNSIQTPIIIGELAIAVVVVGGVLAAAILLVRYKLAKNAATLVNESLSGYIKKVRSNPSGSKKLGSFGSSLRKEKVQPSEAEEPKMSRAEVFSYQELEEATCGFGKECEVGKGSFSCVFRGVLRDGRVVAVKRAVTIAGGCAPHKDSNEFRNELDLLSRLNHAHLLTLLGFCDERGERLLVYEFMANGSLHQQLHGGRNGCALESSSSQLDCADSSCGAGTGDGGSSSGYHHHEHPLGWVRRVTIAVQAARGLEYLHGYACPPVIHRDIKSSNILLDDEWNARVSDFGLSLLGPMDSESPLSELPAGTLGYLDPEYYRLHYLTTKSDVYSFGVLLLEILSGRRAIDMKYEEWSNIVEWAVPLIKAGQVANVLDPCLEPPGSMEAMDKIARIAARCVKMKGRERPSMDKVTTSLERALAMLMGTFCDAQPFLPSEVVLGSSRLHSSMGRPKSSSCTSMDSPLHNSYQHLRHHPPSSSSGSLRRPSSLLSDLPRHHHHSHQNVHQNSDHHHHHHQYFFPNAQATVFDDDYPASPQEHLYLSSNF